MAGLLLTAHDNCGANTFQANYSGGDGNGLRLTVQP